jgi:hypothetical protein
MEQLKLDWSTAEVSDGTLTIALNEKPRKEWRDVFARTAALIGGRWDVTLKPKRASVQVASVQPGDEEAVRQLVEGVVLEANTTLVGEQELFAGASVADERSESDVSEPSRDEELTGRFREFAQEPGGGDDEDVPE